MREKFHVPVHICKVCLCAQSCLTLRDPMDCSPSDSSVHGISHTRILESEAISYIQGIFPTQGSNPYLLHLLHWQLDSLSLCHLGSHISKVQSLSIKKIYFINNSKKDPNFFPLVYTKGWLPQWLSGEESTCQDLGLIPGSGRSPGGGNGSPLQYSYLGNPMDKEAWRATVHGVSKGLDTTQQLKHNKNILWVLGGSMLWRFS